MNTTSWMRRVLAAAAVLVMAGAAPAAQQPPAPTKTRSVFLVMIDGLRWQEVFTGADERLINAENGVKNIQGVKDAYWRPDPAERREKLMPFLWGDAFKRGQVYGNLLKGSDAHITNPWRVSYPGYSETFCGFANEAIKDNRLIQNPEATVFEWLNAKPEFNGKVAAFGAWATFPYIFNVERSGLPVDGGVAPLTFGKTSDAIKVWNTARAETPYRWDGACFDSMVFRPALEWIKLNTPRVVFLGMGETDEWAHAGNYEHYLKAATRSDAYLRELWQFIESSPQYKGTTSVIVLCDHGRGGDAPVADPPLAWPTLEGVVTAQWRDHNAKVAGAQQIWIAVWGPDTPALGERVNVEAVTQSQVAATLAKLLGEDYRASEQRSGEVITEAVGVERK